MCIHSEINTITTETKIHSTLVSLVELLLVIDSPGWDYYCCRQIFTVYFGFFYLFAWIYREVHNNGDDVKTVIGNFSTTKMTTNCRIHFGIINCFSDMNIHKYIHAHTHRSESDSMNRRAHIYTHARLDTIQTTTISTVSELFLIYLFAIYF